LRALRETNHKKVHAETAEGKTRKDRRESTSWMFFAHSQMQSTAEASMNFLLAFLCDSIRFRINFPIAMTQNASYPDIFLPETNAQLFARIDQLRPDTQALWGKMKVDQMLAHCCVPYEQALGLRQDGPNVVMKWMLRLFFKTGMVNEVPYKQSLPTAPAFVIADRRNFEREQSRLKDLIRQFTAPGRAHYDGKEQISLGKLSADEWNNLMFKHLDHHLRQFGV